MILAFLFTSQALLILSAGPKNPAATVVSTTFFVLVVWKTPGKMNSPRSPFTRGFGALRKPRGPAQVSVLGPNDQAGPLSFGPAEACASATFPRLSGYGREPVGNGHAAAGFSAGLAPGVAAVDGVSAAAVSAKLAGGAAAVAFFFFPAFFFFLADFFFPAAFFLPASLNDFFFFLDAFFFFFFLPPFFAFFFAILNLLEGC
jgi:hypothetical protein